MASYPLSFITAAHPPHRMVIKSHHFMVQEEKLRLRTV